MMPITPQYKWKQCGSNVVISVNLHSVSHNQVDLLSLASYLKLSFPPYCLELFLRDSVLPHFAPTKLHKGWLFITLTKHPVGTKWPSLTRELDATAAAAAREVAMQQLQDFLQEEQQRRSAARTVAERACVQQQLQVEEAQQAVNQQLEQSVLSNFFNASDCQTGQIHHRISVTPTSSDEDGFMDGDTNTSTNDITACTTNGASNDEANTTALREENNTSHHRNHQNQQQYQSCQHEQLQRHRTDSVSSAADDSGTESSPSAAAAAAVHASTRLVGGGVRRRISEDREYDGDGEDHYSSTEEVGPSMLSLNDTPPSTQSPAVPSSGGSFCTAAANSSSGRKVRRLLTKKSGSASTATGAGCKEGSAEEEEGCAQARRNTSASGAAGGTEHHQLKQTRNAAAGPPHARSTGKKGRNNRSSAAAIRTSRTVTVSYTKRPGPAVPARESRDGGGQSEGPQVAKATDVRVGSYADAQVDNTTDAQVDKASDAHVSNAADTQTGITNDSEVDNTKSTRVANTKGAEVSNTNDVVVDDIDDRNGIETPDVGKLQDLLNEACRLYEQEWYSESVSVFSSVLEQQPRSVRALSNRAAAHLANGSPRLAISDANKALSLLDPVTPSTLQSRLLCRIRRGAAYAKVGQLPKAIADYKVALELAPHDTKLRDDYNNLRRTLDTTTASETEGSSCGWLEETEEEEETETTPSSAVM